MYIIVHKTDKPIDICIIHIDKEKTIKYLWIFTIEKLKENQRKLDNVEYLTDLDVSEYYIIAYTRRNNGDYYQEKTIIINNFIEILTVNIKNIDYILNKWLQVLEEDIIPEELLNCTIEL
jgi:hypothetical protein